MHVELSIAIPAPVEQVWAVAQDPERRVRWDQRTAAYRWLGPVQVGTEIELTLRMGLLRPKARGKMMIWNPPRKSSVHIYEASSPLVPLGAGSWTFAGADGGTLFTTRFTLKVEALPWYVPKWLFRQAVWWDTWRSLRRLRAMVLRDRGITGGQTRA